MRGSSTAAIQTGLELADWTPVELWRATLAIGGAFTAAEVGAIAAGTRDADQVEHDILAATLNEHLIGAGLAHPVPSWAQLP